MNTKDLITENKKRLKEFHTPYDPFMGTGSLVDRCEFTFIGVDGHRSTYRIPTPMMEHPVIQSIHTHGSISEYLKSVNMPTKPDFISTIESLIASIRFNYDFEFWAVCAARIQDKKSKKSIPFKLNRPQRRLLAKLEELRVKRVPIRIILLKARQWGGSTLVQIYMAWMQTILKTSWHSAIVADVEDQSKNIRNMYTKLAKAYPKEIGTITFRPFEGSSKNRVISESGCVVGIGSAQKPESLRSFDFAMLHLSELGLWKNTPSKSAEDLVQSLQATVPDEPDTIICMESTAKGVGNFFHRSWQSCQKGDSAYTGFFVPWYEIELYQKECKNPEQFISGWGEYEWFLWELGATIEGIYWYMSTKVGYDYDDWRMKSEYPSTADEAFQSSGRRAFAQRYVLNARKTCRKPKFRGELHGDATTGAASLKGVDFQQADKGRFVMWDKPDKEVMMSDRYVCFADIGGRSEGADYSCIKVFDRFWMGEGGVPEVVALWHGHCFVPETKIYTSKGFVEIKDVQIGDLVWTHNNRFKKVTRIYKRQYDGELLSMRSQGNYETVRCTPEHPFLSTKIETLTIRRKASRKGSYSYTKRDKASVIDWVSAEDLEYIAYKKEKHSQSRKSFVIDKYNGGKSKNTKREIRDLDAFFSVLGYYLAEGHIGKRKEDGKPDKIVFSFGYHEKETLVSDCVNQLCKLGFKPTTIDSKNVGVCRVSICDTYFASLVLELCGEHSWAKMINPKIFEYPKRLLSILINSYWQGDGSVYYTDNTKSHTASTVSPILARQIRDILILLGHRPGVFKVRAKTKGVNVKSARARYNIVWTVSKNMKYSLLNGSKHIAYKIKSKSYNTYSGLVYNLEVEDDNSYSTESYVVHNCDQDLFAWKCAQIATYFNNALLAVEVNSLHKELGEGEHFLTVLDEIVDYYENLYARTDPEKIREGIPIKYGFHTNKLTKPMIIDALNAALREGGYIERHLKTCDEMDYYEVKSNGAYGAVEGQNDDLVVITAGGVWLCYEIPRPIIINETKRVVKTIRISESTI